VEDLVDALDVAAGAEGDLGEGLRLTAREDGRAVDAREVAHLAPDGADLVGAAAVEAAALVEDHLAHDAALGLLEGVLDVGLRPALDGGFAKARRDRFGDAAGEFGLLDVGALVLGVAEHLLDEAVADLADAVVEA